MAAALELSISDRKLTRDFANVGFPKGCVKGLDVSASFAQEWTASQALHAQSATPMGYDPVATGSRDIAETSSDVPPLCAKESHS
jgi:hypothetical protein